METNLGKTKEEIVYEILLNLNRGNSGCIDSRVKYAIEQYNLLVEQGIIKEEEIMKTEQNVLNDSLRKAKIYDTLSNKFGCPLEVIVEAINNGIIDAKGNHREVSLSYGFIGGHKKEYYFDAYDYDDTIILPLRDYKYNWWLVSDKENE